MKVLLVIAAGLMSTSAYAADYSRPAAPQPPAKPSATFFPWNETFVCNGERQSICADPRINTGWTTSDYWIGCPTQDTQAVANAICGHTGRVVPILIGRPGGRCGYNWFKVHC